MKKITRWFNGESFSAMFVQAILLVGVIYIIMMMLYVVSPK